MRPRPRPRPESARPRPRPRPKTTRPRPRPVNSVACESKTNQYAFVIDYIFEIINDE